MPGALVKIAPEALDVPGCPSRSMSWANLVVLLAPFSVIYFVLIVTRPYVYDRYLLALMPVVLIFLVRFFQERLRSPAVWFHRGGSCGVCDIRHCRAPRLLCPGKGSAANCCTIAGFGDSAQGDLMQGLNTVRGRNWNLPAT